MLCLLAVHSAAGLIVLAALLGFSSGIYIALPPVIFVALTPDKSKIGTRIGMGFAIFGLGVLAGGPGGGGILQRHGEQGPLDWTGTWIYGGILPLASGVIMAGVRYMRAGLKVKKV
jgi:MFS family permease